MTLAAKQVTEALAARLAPMAATGGRVFETRTVRLTDADLPCWRVVAAGESAEPLSFSGANRHTLDILAGAYARDTEDLEDVLSALLATGQPLLFADPLPYGLQVAAIDRAVVAFGEASVGVYTLTLRATYVVDPRQPETMLSS